MAKVSKQDQINQKYGYAIKSLQWLFKQPDFKDKYAFSNQDEQIAIALVSNEPIWRYLNNRFDYITCADQIVDMSVKAGIQTDSDLLHYFYQLIMAYYLCDAGSYSTQAGGHRNYDFMLFDVSNKEVILQGKSRKRIDDLDAIIEKISKGAIPFTDHVWKAIRQKYLANWVKQNDRKLKAGQVVEGKYFRYRYNSRTGSYEIQPLTYRNLPIYYDPNY